MINHLTALIYIYIFYFIFTPSPVRLWYMSFCCEIFAYFLHLFIFLTVNERINFMLLVIFQDKHTGLNQQRFTLLSILFFFFLKNNLKMWLLIMIHQAFWGIIIRLFFFFFYLYHTIWAIKAWCIKYQKKEKEKRRTCKLFLSKLSLNKWFLKKYIEIFLTIISYVRVKANMFGQHEGE